MSGEEKRRRPAPSATPWDGAGDGELSPAERIVRDCHRDMYRYRHAGAGLVGEADFFNGYDRDACPRCGSPAIEGNGRDANGVRRWRCLSCGRAFNPATGTVFDGRKLPVADWTEFLLEVFSYGVSATVKSAERAPPSRRRRPRTFAGGAPALSTAALPAEDALQGRVVEVRAPQLHLQRRGALGLAGRDRPARDLPSAELREPDRHGDVLPAGRGQPLRGVGGPHDCPLSGSPSASAASASRSFMR